MTVSEVLVASAITATIVGAIVTVARPLRELSDLQPEIIDMQQRLRVGADALMKDLLMAVPPVMPYRADGDRDPDLGTFYRPDAITVLSASWDEAAVTSNTYYLRTDAADGFSQLRHYDGAEGDFPVMDGVGLLQFEYFRFNGAPIDPAALVDGPWFPDAADANRFDADLLTIRRVRVTLRVQPRTLLRGRLTGREIRFDVAPRNLDRD
jgi:hypothetical protein